MWNTGGNREMAVIVGQWQNLITKIQVNLCYLIPASLGIGTKFTWIIVAKIFVTDLPSQPFLGHHLHFTAFSMVAICIGLQLFYSLAVFEWISHLFVSYITWVVFLFCRKKKACKKMWRYYFYCMYCIQILSHLFL